MNVTLLGVTVIAFLFQYVTVKVTTYVTVVYIYKYVINFYILMSIDHCNLCYVTVLRYCMFLLWYCIITLHYCTLLYVTVTVTVCSVTQCYMYVTTHVSLPQVGPHLQATQDISCQLKHQYQAVTSNM